ncbi:MAG TPA: hypothetical protein VJ796_09210 [Acidimicrobiia bacterium]|jgi:hypothetical protein|nr:hypothetical protein [Acidimicrobiia bacterium]
MSSLRSGIEEWAVEGIDSPSDQELSDQIIELDWAISQLECQQARRLAVFGKRQAWKSEGHVSATAFLSARTAPATALSPPLGQPRGDGEDRGVARPGGLRAGADRSRGSLSRTHPPTTTATLAREGPMP